MLCRKPTASRIIGPMTMHEHPAPVRDSRTVSLVSALVSHGLVDPSRQDEARSVVDRALAGQVTADAPLKRRFAELAGYIGGAFVISAAALFTVNEWDRLSAGQQIGLLAGIAVVLAAAGLALAVTGDGFAALRAGEQPVRRRLAGVLLTGAGAAAAAAVGLQLESGTSTWADGPVAGLGTAVTLALLAAVGYLVAPTVVGQLGIAVGAFAAVPFFLDAIGEVAAVAFGLIVLAVGVLWLLLAERGSWRETGSARVIGCVLAIVGAQLPVFGSDLAWVGYLATGLVAAAAFAVYVGRTAWPYLAAGVVGVTLAVPEALLDWTDGSLGSAGVLLVAGLTLLGASLLGFRLRKEVTEQAAT